MNYTQVTRRLQLYECLGFALLITVSWLDELIGLPTLLFGNPTQPNWHEAALETLVILVAAIPTLLLTKRLARRLVYLEGFLRVCSWCKKINFNDQWLPIEKIFDENLGKKTSHGICPDCSEKLEKEI